MTDERWALPVEQSYLDQVAVNDNFLYEFERVRVLSGDEVAVPLSLLRGLYDLLAEHEKTKKGDS